jgi:hypothetical protein
MLKTAWEKTPFGMALTDFAITTGADEETNALRRLRAVAGKSPTFVSLLFKSVPKFVFNPPVSSISSARVHDRTPPQHFEVNDDGIVINARGRPTGKRAIALFATFDDWHYTQHPDTHFGAAGDTIRTRRSDLFGDDADLLYFIHKTAHEMQHAVSTIARPSGTGGVAPPLLAYVAAVMANEAEARITEVKVQRETGDKSIDGSAARTIAQQIDLQNNGTALPQVARSFPSGSIGYTYAEMAIVEYLERWRAGATAVNAYERSSLRNAIDELLDAPAAPGTPPPLADISNPLLTLPEYDKMLTTIGVFDADRNAAIIYRDIALLQLIQRVITFRWRQFDKQFAGSPDYFTALEPIARENAALLLAPFNDASFEAIYGAPFQITPLTEKP